METLESYCKVFKMPMSSLMFFMEKLEQPDSSDKARHYIADKTLKMLDWIATISEKKSEEKST